jgi:hypothetical protein
MKNRCAIKNFKYRINPQLYRQQRKESASLTRMRGAIPQILKQSSRRTFRSAAREYCLKWTDLIDAGTDIQNSDIERERCSWREPEDSEPADLPIPCFITQHSGTIKDISRPHQRVFPNRQIHNKSLCGGSATKKDDDSQVS